MFHYEEHELKDRVEKAILTLLPKEALVVKLRFGIGCDGAYTLEDVGRYLSISRERVRQIEAKALRKLKHPDRRKIIKGEI